MYALAHPMTAPSPDPDPLAPMVRAAVAGDRGAQRSLMRAVASSVVRVVRGMVGPSHPDVDDLVQEGLFAFAKSLPAFRGESSTLHFARQVTVRQTAYVLRRARAERRRHADAPFDDTIADSASSPHASALAAERMEIWHEVLSLLPPEQAEAIALKVLLGHSVEEIATATDAPANTVRSRLRLAKDALRARLRASEKLSALEIEDD
jgi:RNA polymerase sigma-70 factor, ECF subfamily